MTNDNDPVNIRSSLEAQNFWVNNIGNPNITESFRIKNNNNSKKEEISKDKVSKDKVSKDKVKYVFSSKEIKSFQLPYQKQQQPFKEDKNYSNKENVKINLKFPQKGHYPSPIRVRSRRSIETAIFRKELELDELCFQDHIRRIEEISEIHKQALNINKALVVYHQKNCVLSSNRKTK